MSDNNFPIVDNINAPELFASGKICYAMIGQNTVIVTFTSMRWIPDDESSKNVVVGRIAMPLHKAQALALGLNDFLETRGHGATSLATAGLAMQ